MLPLLFCTHFLIWMNLTLIFFRMADPRYPLLETFYEKDHRARLIEEGNISNSV